MDEHEKIFLTEHSLEFIRRVKDCLGLRFKRLENGTIKIDYVRIVDEIDPNSPEGKSLWPEIIRKEA